MKCFFLSIVSFFIFSSFAFAYTIVDSVSTETRPNTILAFGGKIYIANQLSNTVSVLNTTTNLIEDTIAVGSAPLNLAGRGSKIYVANNDENTVSIIDTADNNSVTTVTVGDNPYDFLVYGEKVFVSNSASQNISVIYTDNGVSTITTSFIPFNMVSSSLNKIFVSNFSNQSISVIDPAEEVEEDLITVMSNPNSLLTLNNSVYVVGQSGNQIYSIDVALATSTITISNGNHAGFVALNDSILVSNGTLNQVQIIDTSNGNSITTIENIPAAGSMYVLGTKVFVDSTDGLVVIDTSDNNSTTTIENVRAVFPSAFASIGTRLYVSDEETDILHIIETADITVPTVAISSPADGSVVSGSNIAIVASASDDVLLSGVTFKLDGVELSEEDSSSPYSLNWDSSGAVDGNHVLSAVARDSSNNYATSSINITIQNQHNNRTSGFRASVQKRSVSEDDQEKVPVKKDDFLLGDNSEISLLQSQLQQLISEINKKILDEEKVTYTDFARNLGIGMRGKDVMELQRFLNKRGFMLAPFGPGSLGFETNYFGNLLENALKRFQIANQIKPVSGYFGEMTRKILKNYLTK